MTNYEAVVEGIVKKFICNNCQEYLRPPISFCDDGITICGTCSNLEECKDLIVGRCDILEKIGTLLKFPCYFSDQGCELNIFWNESSSHESKCPFRQFSCPACESYDLRWIGTASNMRTHIKVDHTNLTIYAANAKCSLEHDENVWFFFYMDELYVLLYNCDLLSEKLFFAVKFVGSYEHAKRCHFKLTLQYKNKEVYCDRKRVESADHWQIDAGTAVNIDLPVLKMKLQVRNQDVINFEVEVFVRKPLYNGIVDEELLQSVECLVCQDYMIAPIYQCIVGHSFCEYCKPKLKQCPVCRAKIGESRNFALESICAKLHYQCLYADDGCKYSSSLDTLLDHENNCQYGYVDCPFKSFLAECKWKGKLDQINQHTSHDHGVKF